MQLTVTEDIIVHGESSKYLHTTDMEAQLKQSINNPTYCQVNYSCILRQGLAKLEYLLLCIIHLTGMVSSAR